VSSIRRLERSAPAADAHIPTDNSLD